MADPELQKTPTKKRNKILQVMSGYYAIALVVGGGAIFIFAWLAEEVMDSDFTKLSTQILLAIHSHTSPVHTQIAFFFTNIGSVAGVVVCSAVFIFYLWRSKKPILIYTYCVTLAGSAFFVFVLKLAFHQIRPHVFVPLVAETNFSFPSGHALMSFTFWGFLGWYLVSLNHRQLWRWLLAVVFLGIAGSVALSRLYLGVHWPTDVLAGALIATFWISVCTAGYEWTKRRTNSSKPTLTKGDTPATPKPA